MLRFSLGLLAVSLQALPPASAANGTPRKPESFLFTSAGELAATAQLLARSDIGGAQVVYNWRRLEPEKGRSDFSAIERDLALVDGIGKMLVIQGLGSLLPADRSQRAGLPAQRSRVRGRSRFPVRQPGIEHACWLGLCRSPMEPWRSRPFPDASRRIGRTLRRPTVCREPARTSVDLYTKKDNAGFTCDAYFEAEMDNLAAARRAFQRTRVVQYVNFWPCEWENDHDYMGRLFAFVAKNDVGLVGPYVVPGRKGQMRNSYPFFNRYRASSPSSGWRFRNQR